ncbi:hypothetical protein ACHAWT_000174 [Skeletonema menzelii]
MVKDHEDPRVNATLGFLETNPNLKLPEAMRAAKFTLEESQNPSVQMTIRRRRKRKLPANVTVYSPTDASASAVSTLTTTPVNDNTTKEVRHTTHAAQTIRRNKKIKERKRIDATKRATAIFKVEKDKPKGTDGKLSAKQVSELVEKETKIRISDRTIQQAVADGRAGLSPPKQGRPSALFSNETFEHLTNAFESFIKINQLNGMGGKLTSSKLTNLLKECTQPVIGCNCSSLLSRLLNAASIDLKRGRSNNAEERRVQWTTYSNLKSWFNNWERDLIELGFAYQDDDGKVIIPPEQLARIMNIDETALIMDASTSQRGGRPEATFYYGGLPNLGNQSIKNSLSTTMITGSTAAGEAIPPHFQFSTAAQSDDTQRFRYETLAYMKKVKGKWGHEEEASYLPSIGMNEKGGMSDEEFLKYFETNLTKLYPDAEDVPGKRVMLKVDSGPGRLYPELLVKARTYGFVIYPGVPNTTAVTQETDQNYGPFKTQFQKNLKELSEARVGCDNSSIPPWIVGLLVFGGKDPVSKHVIETCAFTVGFCREQNIGAWLKCGAAPLTRTPLDGHPKVRRELNDADDGFNAMMREIQAGNISSTILLCRHGYNGQVFEATIKKKREQRAVTEEHSQERIDLLAKAKTHGHIFHATGGAACSGDDALLALEKKVRESTLKALTKKKREAQKFSDVEMQAKSILVRTGGLRGKDLTVLLKWYGVRGADAMNVEKSKDEWNKILQSMKDPPPREKWTDADEEELLEASKPITLRDTALGRHHENIARQFRSGVLPNMTREQREALMEDLDRMGDADSPMDTGVSVMPNLDDIDTEIAPPAAAQEQPLGPSVHGTNDQLITGTM